MITSGAGLFLTMAEARLKEPGAIYVYFASERILRAP